jgi:hypothetical protein
MLVPSLFWFFSPLSTGNPGAADPTRRACGNCSTTALSKGEVLCQLLKFT